MPGAVANNFAQSRARSHDDRVLTEREWEQFGQDLLLRDLARRQYWMGKDRPDLALNLPVKDIQSAHDASFEKARIDPRSEEHTSELQSLMRNSYTVFCLKQKTTTPHHTHSSYIQRN